MQVGLGSFVLGIHRHIGGLEMHDLNRYYQNKIHRHIGGLENRVRP